MTDPRGEITLKANFQRPLGADGIGLVLQCHCPQRAVRRWCASQ
jgi:hypothetical protein